MQARSRASTRWADIVDSDEDVPAVNSFTTDDGFEDDVFLSALPAVALSQAPTVTRAMGFVWPVPEFCIGTASGGSSPVLQIASAHQNVPVAAVSRIGLGVKKPCFDKVQAKPKRCSVVQHPKDVVNTCEDEWQRRLEKRQAAIRLIKSSQEYKAVAACCHTARPRTPNPCNRASSKRDWEAETMRWRAALKRLQAELV